MNSSPAFDHPRNLRPNPWNTNVVSPDNEAKIDESIRRHGFIKPIIVRTLADGTTQILGGAHRRDSAIRLGLTSVPIFNLGEIDDQKAKEIGLIDNARYGADDTLQLAQLLESLGTPDDLAAFLPYTDSDFASIFSSVTIALDDLDIPDDDHTAPSAPKVPAVQTHQVMRFKVPAEDCKDLQQKIEKVMKRQGFSDSDQLTNAGDALVWLLNQVEV
jgi:ParB-like chromosome segregation protein Spo0J